MTCSVRVLPFRGIEGQQSSQLVGVLGGFVPPVGLSGSQNSRSPSS
jgi:hypothetical protein